MSLREVSFVSAPLARIVILCQGNVVPNKSCHALQLLNPPNRFETISAITSNPHDFTKSVPGIEVERFTLVVCALHCVLHVIGVFALPRDVLW